MSDGSPLPWVVGHRGASADRPENTLAAFREALAQGADAIELDLRLSADGVPVVHHDPALTRAGQPRLLVGDLPAAELARIDVGAPRDPRYAGETIPTLDAVLGELGGRTRLLLEWKPEGRAERDVELVRATLRSNREAGAGDRVRVLSYAAPLLDVAARMAPDIPRILNIGPESRPGPMLRSNVERCDGVCADVRTLVEPFVAWLARLGRPLWVFTCNDDARADRARAAGATALLTDRPGWLRERFAREGRGA